MGSPWCCLKVILQAVSLCGIWIRSPTHHHPIWIFCRHYPPQGDCRGTAHEVPAGARTGSTLPGTSRVMARCLAAALIEWGNGADESEAFLSYRDLARSWGWMRRV